MESSVKKGQEEYKDRKAVIIADTYTSLLNPLNNETCEVLLPVCNIPILEYMIDFLLSSSIKEIIICAKSNKGLDTYLKKYHKKEEHCIKLITSDSGEEFVEMGDCLRKINAEKMINSDFVLIRGLVITNIDLEKAFNFHIKKKEQDPSRILTSLLKTFKNDKDVRTKYDENFLIYDKSTNKILQYESTHETRKVKLNENVKFKLKAVQSAKTEQYVANYYKIRSDLYDTGIDICSPDLLDRFSENFDYHSIRDHIYKHLIVSEIYSDTFYLYELSADEYVGLVKNIESYQKVNLEILNRWAHPIVLEHISLPPALKINYKAMNMNIYIDSDVIVDSRSKLNSSIALSRGCIIEENAEITSSIIGKNTQIGSNCKVKNSIICFSSKIGKDTQIINSIIGNKCTIGSGLVVVDCIVGDEVVLKTSHTGLRIYNSTEEENINDSHDEIVDSVLVKVDKDTFLRNLEDKDLLFVNEDAEKVEENEEDDDEDEDSLESEEMNEEENYEEEIKEVIRNGIEADKKVEDVLKEISSLKNSFFEYSLSETTKYSFSVIFQDFIEKNIGSGTFEKSHIGPLKEMLFTWKGIFGRFVPNENEQLYFISVLEDLCIEYPKFIDVFHVIIQLLNSDEFNLLPDEIIVKWAEKETSEYPTSEGYKEIHEVYHKSFKEKMKKFLDQLSLY